MIGYLSGNVKFISNDCINIFISGIGYNVFAPPTTIGKYNIGDNIDLYIYTHVREDTFDLYGFKTQDELYMFKLLMTVSGIGAKTSLTVIDKGVENIKLAIINADVDFFTVIPRLGKKNAQRIIIDLKNKLGGISELDLSRESNANMEVIDALSAMGYSKQESLYTLKNMPSGLNNIEDKIRFALKNMGKNK